MSLQYCHKAVILAAGHGSRMRNVDQTVALSPEQRRAAADGAKVMMPFARPFLDYVLTALVDAGFSDVCLVISPHAAGIRRYYCDIAPPSRLKIAFAEQSEPRGTAHAVLAAEQFAGKDPFVLINGDNLYPTEPLRQLRQLQECGLVGFELKSMLGDSNVTAQRIAGFAVVRGDHAGCLTDILEKPARAVLNSLPPPVLLSMNCWRFNRNIFAACRAIGVSPRGELELPDAVLHDIREHAARYQILPSRQGVWDLSCRSDVPRMAHLLRGREVRL